MQKISDPCLFLSIPNETEDTTDYHRKYQKNRSLSPICIAIMSKIPKIIHSENHFLASEGIFLNIRVWQSVILPSNFGIRDLVG